MQAQRQSRNCSQGNTYEKIHWHIVIAKEGGGRKEGRKEKRREGRRKERKKRKKERKRKNRNNINIHQQENG